MNVSRRQIIARGLTNRCPNCGGRTLFKEGTLFEVNKECRGCGLLIERDEGGFLGGYRQGIRKLSASVLPGAS